MSLTLTHYSPKNHVFLEEYNLTKKVYSNGVVKFKKTSFSTLKGFYKENRHTGTMSEKDKDEKCKKYLKTVRTNIVDLAMNFDKWEYFITLTFDFRKKEEDEEEEEYTHEKAIELLKKWINNQKHQNRNMTYILVPEFHKNGHLHFHGLIANVPKWEFSEAINPHNGELIIKNGLQIYNLDNYKLGFTTISKIQDQEKVSNYISKYATKELITLKSKKRYWYSRNLKKPNLFFEFIDTNLKEHLKYEDLEYYNNFDKESCSIEVAEYKRQHNSYYNYLEDEKRLGN